MLCARLEPRGIDDWGDGAFLSKRGYRKHNGFDYRVFPGSYIVSPVIGEVSKIGRAYSDDPKWRYVQITDLTGNKWRVFYIDPLVIKGETVHVLTSIGIAMNISERYHDYTKAPMPPHIHVEVKAPNGAFLNPESFHV